MRDRFLFDSDDFEQNPPVFARTLANVLRSRDRHGHLVRPVLAAREVAAAEADECSGIPTVGPRGAPDAASRSRRSTSCCGRSGHTRLPSPAPPISWTGSIRPRCAASPSASGSPCRAPTVSSAASAADPSPATAPRADKAAAPQAASSLRRAVIRRFRPGALAAAISEVSAPGAPPRFASVVPAPARLPIRQPRCLRELRSGGNAARSVPEGTGIGRAGKGEPTGSTSPGPQPERRHVPDSGIGTNSA